MPHLFELSELNALGKREFVARLGAVFEHSPWVAQRAWEKRPFASLEELHAAMVGEIRRASPEEQLALVRAHPELAGREAAAGELTSDSSSEQGRLGLTRLSSGELKKMQAINQAYREKFGFPCIVALRLHCERASVLAEMERRTANDRTTELGNALEQIAHIALGRLHKMIA